VFKNKKKDPNGITFAMILVIVMAMSIVILLATVKIYLSNQIYHESKVVNKIKSEISALKAEKMILEQKAEALKFQTQVADTIFTIYGGE